MNELTLEALLDEFADRIARRLHDLAPTAPADGEGGSPWMNVRSAAAYLDWPVGRIYKLTAQNAIPHYKHERRLLFHRGELDRWVKEGFPAQDWLSWPEGANTSGTALTGRADRLAHNQAGGGS